MAAWDIGVRACMQGGCGKDMTSKGRYKGEGVAESSSSHNTGVMHSQYKVLPPLPVQMPCTCTAVRELADLFLGFGCQCSATGTGPLSATAMWRERI